VGFSPRRWCRSALAPALRRRRAAERCALHTRSGRTAAGLRASCLRRACSRPGRVSPRRLRPARVRLNAQPQSGSNHSPGACAPPPAEDGGRTTVRSGAAGGRRPQHRYPAGGQAGGRRPFRPTISRLRAASCSERMIRQALEANHRRRVRPACARGDEEVATVTASVASFSRPAARQGGGDLT
jgi:hypothetical protein